MVLWKICLCFDENLKWSISESHHTAKNKIIIKIVKKYIHKMFLQATTRRFWGHGLDVFDENKACVPKFW